MSLLGWAAFVCIAAVFVIMLLLLVIVFWPVRGRVADWFDNICIYGGIATAVFGFGIILFDLIMSYQVGAWP